MGFFQVILHTFIGQNYEGFLKLEQEGLSISQLNLIMLDPDIKELIRRMKKCLE